MTDFEDKCDDIQMGIDDLRHCLDKLEDAIEAKNVDKMDWWSDQILDDANTIREQVEELAEE